MIVCLINASICNLHFIMKDRKSRCYKDNDELCHAFANA